MLNTILKSNNSYRSTQLLKNSFLGLTPIALIIAVSAIVYMLTQADYWHAMSIVVIVMLITYRVWSVSFKNKYQQNLVNFSLIIASLIALGQGFHHHGNVTHHWIYPSILFFYFIFQKRDAILANGALIILASVFSWINLGPTNSINYTVTLLITSILLAIFFNILSNHQIKLELQAATDNLTGLLNRTILYQSLEHAVEHHRRTGLDMTLITLDIDHFKTINDSYGHDAGDSVLQNLGELLQNRVRKADKVFRVGGEEFMVLLFATDLEHGQQVAEELRQSIESAQLLKNQPITVSLGVAALQKNEDWTTWVKRSDENLYAAKSSGRNRVYCINPVNNAINNNKAASSLNLN